MKKILYISGTRADYGLMKKTLIAIDSNKDLDLEIVVTGMHLMKEFGKTVSEIQKDNFKIHKIATTFKSDDRLSMAKFLSEFMLALTKKIKKIKPDIIFVLGDRAEMLGAASVGMYAGIPVAHVQGGDVSSTVDDIARHTITKLSQIHFPATKQSAKRVISMGEDLKTVFVCGSPGIEDIDKDLFSKKYIVSKYGLDSKKPYLVMIQHPVSVEEKDAGKQVLNTLNAIKNNNLQAILVFPNADAGGRNMIKVINSFNSDLIKSFKSIPRKDFLSLMKYSAAMIGNSSSGIIESASFQIPVINIGTRQKGRERGNNVIDTSYSTASISSALNKCLYDKKFKQKVKLSKNPYALGKTSKIIVQKLLKTKLDDKLLQKRLK